MRSEIEAAAQEIWEYLGGHGDAPVLTIKNALGRHELCFYMGLGDLILEHRITIQEREGEFCAIQCPQAAKAA